jgi:hypothetical protein
MLRKIMSGNESDKLLHEVENIIKAAESKRMEYKAGQRLRDIGVILAEHEYLLPKKEYYVILWTAKKAADLTHQKIYDFLMEDFCEACQDDKVFLDHITPLRQTASNDQKKNSSLTPALQFR